MSAAFDKPELTATDVITRIFGVGMYEADIMLADFSVEEKQSIIEAYDSKDTEAVYKILEKTLI